jgi:hypothetical protein
MQVTFEMTKDDYIAFNVHHQGHSPIFVRSRRNVTGILALFGLGLGALSMLPGNKASIFVGLSFLSIFFFLSAARHLLNWRDRVRKAVERVLGENRNLAMLGKKEIVLTPVEMTAVGDLKSATYRWKAVEKIEGDDEHHYIYVGPLEAVIIPRRAFASDAEYTAFADTARKYWKDATIAPPTGETYRASSS